MSWDSKVARRRQSSAASGTRNIAIHARQQAKRSIQPQSQHVADPFLQDFLNPSFDPASYLNATLPPLQTSSRTPASQASSQAPVPLSELSIQTQTVLSQLNAHTTRLTNTLTELTNEILRSGGRLAYEVELLRGETLGLAETLTEGLEDDIAKFVPGGIKDSFAEPRTATDGHSHGTSTHQRRASILSIPPQPPAIAAATTTTSGSTEPSTTTDTATADPTTTTTTTTPPTAPNEPPYITQLRTLTLVRARLESVIKTFGDAMEFVFPPSALSVSSSFLSVSAPDAGGNNHSTEEKGQQVLQKLRDEVAGLLLGLGSSDGGGDGPGDGDPIKGIEDAARRVEELKDLALVWKGTAEEKGRAKFIESLARMVEDRHRELLREANEQQQQQQQAGGRRDGGGRAGSGGKNDGSNGAGRVNGGGDADGAGQAEAKGYAGAYGLISQLQKLRNGL
ncbi:uncharacterized protein C8A04DRAFT_37854 [Dichotomopilus funicola]|uniref:Uncharacterized protein n=1 Tax=Dichotomopilus funicola TaxID=1934379 RepID=A0AAN6V183_9PEZI|nr:hypothetical protein C8A04DRAFT_37854 [Dichotomopilus funicola]